MEIKIIAHIETDFKEKFGIPRQSGLVPELRGRIVFEPEFRNPDMLRGLEDFKRLWLFWIFSKVPEGKWSPTVRPPKIGGNTRKGVFATRSPFRPNPVGLSCVKIERIFTHSNLGPIIEVSGVDLLDGTPIYDIKPYLAYVDAYPEAGSGFAATDEGAVLEVEDPNGRLKVLPVDKRAALIKTLAQDPRPGYQEDENRVYGIRFGDYNIRFIVRERHLVIEDVEAMG